MFFITGVVENKWGNLTADKVMLKNIRKKVQSNSEIKELYRKAGVDSGYLIAFNKMIKAQAEVAIKYKAVIKSNPQMWRKVTKELTSAIPKPLSFSMRSQH